MRHLAACVVALAATFTTSCFHRAGRSVDWSDAPWSPPIIAPTFLAFDAEVPFAMPGTRIDVILVDRVRAHPGAEGRAFLAWLGEDLVSSEDGSLVAPRGAPVRGRVVHADEEAPPLLAIDVESVMTPHGRASVFAMLDETESSIVRDGELYDMAGPSLDVVLVGARELPPGTRLRLVLTHSLVPGRPRPPAPRTPEL